MAHLCAKACARKNCGLRAGALQGPSSLAQGSLHAWQLSMQQGSDSRQSCQKRAHAFAPTSRGAAATPLAHAPSAKTSSSPRIIAASQDRRQRLLYAAAKAYDGS